MDQSIRNKLRSVVTQCRKLLEEAVRQVLQGQFGIYESGKKDEVHVEDEGRMKNLSDEDKGYRRDIQAHLGHIEALGYKAKDSLAQLVREIAFTHLNRLCAYKMMEARAVWIGGKPFRESVSRGMKSQGFQFYLADHPEDKTLFDTGHQDVAYRHFLGWLGATLSEEIGVLFSPTDPANRLFPPQRVLDEVLALLNSDDLKDIWAVDETIGWVYQYFTPKELRDQVRKESAAPRNSYELAFRNQFFTPRYVVEFLTDNTLGRIWYEMRMGQTKLTESCRYLVHRPDEVFLAPSTCEGHEHFQEDCGAIAKLLLEGDENTFPPFSAKNDAEIQRMISLSHCVSAYQRLGDDCWPIHERLQLTITGGELKSVSTKEILDFLFLTCRSDRHGGDGSVYKDRWFVAAANEVRRRVLEAKKEDLTQEQLLKAPVFVAYRPKKDPRELRILDPACGSGHFLLYCFDLLLTIYEEAYTDADLGPKLQEEYKTLDALKRDVPRLILAHNLHGIDIDLRASQIAALALWLRCQRAYREMNLKQDRPKISKSNIVCAEPMPGESEMLDDFLKTLKQDHLETLIRRVMQVPESTRVRATESMVESLTELVRLVWDKMQFAGEAGSLLKVEEELREAIRKGQDEWENKQSLFRFVEFSLTDSPKESYVRFVPGQGASFWERAEALVLEALRDYARHAANEGRLQRQLFADDAQRGFAFIDTFQKLFDVMLMNPPFGEPSIPSKAYIVDSYGDTKGDVYKAFIECAASRMNPSSFLGIISSRAGFFLAQSADWRERVVLRLYRPVALADLGQGVLDAMVETATYVLRSLNTEERGRLTLNLVPGLASVPKDQKGSFSVPQYRSARPGLKRHQAEDELRMLLSAGFVNELPGHHRRFHVSQKAPLSIAAHSTDEDGQLTCLRVFDEDEKARKLHLQIASIASGHTVSHTYILDLSSISEIPGSPFAYWLSHKVRRLFGVLPTLEGNGRQVRVGDHPGDGFRFLRLFWEVPAPSALDWRTYQKGGDYSPFYYDIPLVADWDEARQTYRGFHGRPGRPNERPSNYQLFFRPGITWPRRSQRGLSVRPLPAGCVFADKGPVVFAEEAELLPLLSVLNSSAFKGLLALQVAFGSFETGAMQRTVIPVLDCTAKARLGTLALRAISLKRGKEASNETSHAFALPLLVKVAGSTLYERCSAACQWDQAMSEAYSQVHADIDNECFSLYGFDQEEREQVEAFLGLVSRSSSVEESDETNDDEENDAASLNIAALVSATISYCVGCDFGRWDVRLASSAPNNDEVNPFAAYPKCSPGCIRDDEGVPARSVPPGYPIVVDQDGIIPDDPDHTDDIVRRVREVLELIWKDRADAIEKEACEILGVKELRDYFRKPGKGGFWDDHVSRYSKSRRKAPIYWLLQSSKKNYGLWLYYHRLDKDMLFKARQNYVDPKIRLEQTRLDSLRSQKTAVGADAKGAKKIDKDIERQEALLGELKDFAEKLERAAKLNFGNSEKLDSNVVYDPDLNDGVVLNIAPLWELVPWKEAKNYWEELLEGKYEWSSMGKLLRAKGLVK